MAQTHLEKGALQIVTDTLQKQASGGHWILRESHSGEGRWREDSAVGQLLRNCMG